MKEFKRYTKQNLPAIASRYGLDHQIRKLFEEGEEMLEALRDVIDNGKDEKRIDHLIEEIGDVFNVGEQIALLLDREEYLAMSRAFKVNRQLRRMRRPIMESWIQPEITTFINDNGEMKPHYFYSDGTN